MGEHISRRRMLAIGAGASLPIALSGCLSGNPKASKPKQQSGSKDSGEVEWWTINLQKGFGDYIQGLIDAYKIKYPKVKINWVDVPGQDITTKLLAAIASSKVPDLVNFTSFTVGLFGDSMADLSQHFSEQEFSGYAEGLRKPLVDSAGKQIAIPWYNGGTSLGFYNTKLMSAVDFDPANPPKTFDDALGLAETYRKKTGKYATNLMCFSNVVQQYDVPLLSQDRKSAAFNTDQTLGILANFKKQFDAQAIAPGTLSEDVRNLPQTLDNRRVAFEPLSTSSNLSLIQTNAPSVYDSIAVAAAATGPSGTYWMPGQQIFGIPKASDNQAAAAEWLKFVTSAENQLDFCKLAPIYPSTLATLKDPFFTTVSDKTPSDTARKILLETFPSSVDATIGTPNDEQFRLLFDEEVRAYMSGKKPAKEAMDAAETAWNAELAKAK